MLSLLSAEESARVGEGGKDALNAESRKTGSGGKGSEGGEVAGGASGSPSFGGE